MNDWHGVGNLTRDPESSVTQSGKDSCKFTIAVNRPKNANGESEADFFLIRCYNARAKTCTQYLRKGSKVAVSGPIRTYSYDDNGVRRYGFYVEADDVNFLPASNPNKGQFGDVHSDLYGAAHHDLNDPNPATYTAVETDELPF